MEKRLLPADKYIVINQTVLTDQDKKILINLYEPIVGAEAISLYLTLWSDLDRQEIMSLELNHHHLMTIIKNNLDNILKSRKSLEAIGLIKSFYKKGEDINSYIYELYSPMSAHEFFNHPIMSVLLLNNIGAFEYNDLLNYYKKSTYKKSEYEEITSSMNQTFDSVSSVEETTDVIKQNKLGIKVDNLIDFDLIIDRLPKGLVNEKTFNKRTRDLINQLAFVYNVETLKMSDIISASLDDIGTLNKESLIKNVRKNYEFNNDGKLPTLIYKTQPDYLKSPKGDTSNRAKMIHVFENTKPYDFLRYKNKGAKPTNRELEMIETIACDYNMPAGVLNVLIDYAIRVNDGKLNKKYLEAIATTWSRKGIKTVEDAMNALTKTHKKTIKEIKPKKEIIMPSWINKKEEKENVSDEELRELQELYKEFR